MNGLWAWADPERCDEWTYLNDPWACNYIAFTNCSHRVKSEHLISMDSSGYVDWEDLDDFFHANVSEGGVGINDHLRQRYRGMT